jgi:FMN-dependent NADH-azoreductase
MSSSEAVPPTTNQKPQELKATVMKSLLYITSSPQGQNSQSIALAQAFLAAFKNTHPDHKVITRDLNAEPIPHVDGEALFAGYTPEEKRPDSMQKKHDFRLKLIDEISKVDEILVAVPMWNWSIPSVLKAYIDQLIMPGVFDNYTKKLAGKRVTVALATGGGYSPDSWHPEWDFATGYLKHIFTAMGSTDVEVIRTEYTLAGIVPGMEAMIDKKEQSFKDAKVAVESRARTEKYQA